MNAVLAQLSMIKLEHQSFKMVFKRESPLIHSFSFVNENYVEAEICEFWEIFKNEPEPVEWLQLL